MPYEQLYKLYYKNKDVYNKACQERKNSIGSYELPLFIGENKSFYVVTNDMVNLICQILQTVSQTQRVNDRFPPIAQNFFKISCLIDEAEYTNSYEGVKSSRRELLDVLKNSENGSKANFEMRFSGLLDRYMHLGTELRLSTSQDIRDLYNDLILPEVEDEKDKPDGKIFRKESVSVMTGAQKEVHRGLTPESKIVENMEIALRLLENDEIPILIRIAAFHYYFGYIHPFYDGNGRMSRFISSYLIYNHVDQLLAYRLSYTIFNMRKVYEKAFEDCNNFRNAGDLTPFILAFLKIVLSAAKDLLMQLEYSAEKLDYFFCAMGAMDICEAEREILFILVQNALFALEGADRELLSKSSHFGLTKVSNVIKMLRNKGYPIQEERVRHRKVYSLDMDQFEIICAQYEKPL